MMDEDPCWSPDYKNASHPGLISFISYDNDPTNVTTTKATYTRQIIEKPKMAPRKKVRREKAESEMRQRFWEEMNRPKEKLVNYGKMSIYKEDYPTPPGFVPSDDIIDPEDLEKYDLYTDPARSIYLDMIYKTKPNMPNKDMNTVFRKKSFFAKSPWSELE